MPANKIAEIENVHFMLPKWKDPLFSKYNQQSRKYDDWITAISHQEKSMSN